MTLVSHLSHWMKEGGLEPCSLTSESVGAFLALRRAQGCKLWISQAALAPLLGYLRRLGAAPEPSQTPPATGGLDRVIEEYRAYLVTERGLAPRSIRKYLPTARLFLSEQSAVGEWSLKEPTASAVTSFVVRAVGQRCAASGKSIAQAMRSLLRYLYVSGKIGKPLDRVVPGVASWRLSTLPKALERNQVDRILAACNRTTAVGQRDFAILTILVRLGLRAGEVAALKLSDIDWRRGEIVVYGKANRAERLPLPVDVGQAVVDWLMQYRPAGSTSHVFTRVHAPHHGLTFSAVSSVVHAACVRAGVPPVGAHHLRHTAATQMLRAGADLAEVGQVLRHHSLDVTAIYAKVDRRSLSALARPWPREAV